MPSLCYFPFRYKLILELRGLARAQGKHDEQLAKVQKAEEVLRTKTEHHQSLVSKKEVSTQNVEQAKQVKAVHEATAPAAAVRA